VDTDALVDALREGRLAGAALDVVTPAPLPATHPLWKIPNVWITSHSSSGSLEGQYDALTTVLADVSAMHRGLAPLNPVPELRAMGPLAALHTS
jgi:phosphoglycerate dehydrogenase-like enzyme